MGVHVAKEELPFAMQHVGTFSCHGVEPGHRAGETSAKINQDRGCIVFPFGNESAYPAGVKSQAFFCVYDGHGANGDKVSHFVMNKLQEELSDHEKLYTDPPAALKDAYVKTDQLLLKDKNIDAELSGTTAVTVLIRLLDNDEMHCWTAWTGDSRAVYACKKGGADWVHKDMSEDQKPDTPKEMARIQKAGGFVSPPEVEWGGPARVWLDAEMTLPGLAMARSIGDHLVKSVGVSAEPEVEYFVAGAGEYSGTQPFIVICSDGVWEFIESDMAVKLIGSFAKPSGDIKDLDATVAATKLIETSAAKWRQEEGDYRDDITAIVLKLDEVKAVMRAGAAA